MRRNWREGGGRRERGSRMLEKGKKRVGEAHLLRLHKTPIWVGWGGGREREEIFLLLSPLLDFFFGHIVRTSDSRIPFMHCFRQQALNCYVHCDCVHPCINCPLASESLFWSGSAEQENYPPSSYSTTILLLPKLDLISLSVLR